MDDFTKDVVDKLVSTGEALLTQIADTEILTEEARKKAAALSTAITHAKDYLASMKG